MNKFMRLFKNKPNNNKNILNALELARKECPNDMEFGNVVGKFLIEVKESGKSYSSNELYDLMNVELSLHYNRL